MGTNKAESTASKKNNDLEKRAELLGCRRSWCCSWHVGNAPIVVSCMTPPFPSSTPAPRVKGVLGVLKLAILSHELRSKKN